MVLPFFFYFCQPLQKAGAKMSTITGWQRFCKMSVWKIKTHKKYGRRKSCK